LLKKDFYINTVLPSLADFIASNSAKLISIAFVRDTSTRHTAAPVLAASIGRF
jgi:hypothetical protein